MPESGTAAIERHGGKSEVRAVLPVAMTLYLAHLNFRNLAVTRLWGSSTDRPLLEDWFVKAFLSWRDLFGAAYGGADVARHPS